MKTPKLLADLTKRLIIAFILTPIIAFSQDTIDFETQNFDRIKDPTLGFAPYERLAPIRENILLNQSSLGGIPNLQWFERGPNNSGGRTRAIMFDPFVNSNNDPYKKVWAGGIGGGLWWTNDITVTQPSWNHVSALWDNLAVSCITTDKFRNNGDNYFIGTGEAWWRNGQGSFIAPYGGGIFKGTRNSSGVVIWANVALASTNPLNFPEFTYIQKILFADPFNSSQQESDLYVATATGGLQFSNDGGITFNQVIGTGIGNSQINETTDLETNSDNDVFVAMSGIGLYAISNNNKIFRKDFGSNLFTDITPPNSQTGQSYGRIELETSQTDPNLIYALINTNNIQLKLLKSINKGTTWSVIPLSGISSAATNWFDLAFEINPFDNNQLSIGTLNINLSDNGATNFVQKSKESISVTGNFAVVHRYQHAIEMMPRVSPRTVFANSGGVYFCENFDNIAPSPINIASKNIGYNVSQLYTCAMKNLHADNYYIVGTHDAGVQLNSNNNAGIANTDFAIIAGSANLPIEEEKISNCFVDQNDPTIQIACLKGSERFYYSLNNGISWSANIQGPQTSAGWCTSLVKSASDYDSREKTLFLSYGDLVTYPDHCFYNQLVRYKKTATGFQRYAMSVNWPLHVPIENREISHIKVLKDNLQINSSTIFIGTQQGRIYKISNIPNSIQSLPINAQEIVSPVLGFSISCIEIGATEADILITVSNFNNNFRVFETHDGGLTWVDKSGNLPDMPVYWALYNINNRNQVLLATEMGVWSTNDISAASVQWGFNPASGIPAIRVYQLRTREADNLVLAATHGRGLWATDIFNQPIANFNFIEKDGCSLNFDFTDLSYPSITSWLWDFDDGTTSTLQNPSHIFASPGQYNVSLTVTNSSGSNTISQQVNATLNCCTAQVEFEPNKNASDYWNDLNNSAITTYLVKGRFTINQPIGLNGKEFIALPGAEIIVNQGIVFTTDNCIFRSCSDMWKGIYVMEEAKISLTNCIVRDADIGLHAHFKANFDVFDCDFINNIIGIYSAKDGFSSKEGNMTIVGTHFNFSGALKLPYFGQNDYGTTPYAGISLRFRHGTIGSNYHTANTFDKLNSGILINYADMNIQNCEFETIRNEGFYPEPFMGSAIYVNAPNYFYQVTVDGSNFSSGSNVPSVKMIDCDYGVYSNGMQTTVNSCYMENVDKGVFVMATDILKRISISNNDITAVVNGIHFYLNPNAQSLVALHNKITTTGKTGVGILAEEAVQSAVPLVITENSNVTCIGGEGGIWVTNFIEPSIKWNNVSELGLVQPNYAGIRLTLCNRADVSCNATLGSNIDVGKFSSAIRIMESSESIIHCNTVDNTNYGVSFFGNCPSTFLQDNSIWDHEFGLFVNNTGITGSMPHYGNRWLGNYTAYGARNENLSSISNSPANVKITVDNTVSSNYFPTIDPNNNTVPSWIDNLVGTGGNTYVCSTSECNPDPINRMMQTNFGVELAIAGGSYNTEEFEQESKDMAKLYLYNKLYNDSALKAQYSSLQSFYSAYQNTSIDYLQKTKNQIVESNAYDHYYQNVLHTADSLLNNKIEQLSLLDSIRLVNGGNSSIDSMQAALRIQMNTLKQVLDQAVQQHNSNTVTRVSSALSYNSAVQSNKQVEQNQQLIDKIYLETVAAGIYTLNNSQSADVMSVATQCPWTGGAAVFSARTIYKLTKLEVNYDDFSTCIAQGIFRKGKKVNDNLKKNNSIYDSKFSISPNPSNQEVTLYFDSESNADKNKFEIFDVRGKQIAQFLLTENEKIFSLSVGEWSNGVYYVKSQNSNKIIKLIVLH